MMLSATGFESPAPVLDTAQFQIIPLRYVQTASDVTLTPLVTDGGFIQYRFESVQPDLASDVGTLAFNQHGTSVAGIVSQNLFGVAGQDVNVLPPWQLTTAYDSDGLQPAVIVSQTNGSGLAPDLKPVVLGPNPSAPGAGEGGSIPIHAIFADFRKDSQLASGVKAVATPAVELSIESLASARQLSTPDNAIAGEWARAMVFEIAGGEPSHQRHPFARWPADHNVRQRFNAPTCRAPLVCRHVAPESETGQCSTRGCVRAGQRQPH